MTNTYGPWATAIHIDNAPRLCAFWKRRLMMLAATNRRTGPLTSRSVLGLLVLGVLTCALPTLQTIPATARQFSQVETPDSAPESKKGDELKKLQGNWVHDSWELDGELKKYPPDFGFILSIAGNRWTKRHEGKVVSEGRLAIDNPTSTPKQFTVTFTKGLGSPSTGFGIYEISDGTLKYCICKTSDDQLPQLAIDPDSVARRIRPTEFETEGKRGVVCYTLRKRTQTGQVLNQAPPQDPKLGTLTGRFVYDGDQVRIRFLQITKDTAVFGDKIVDESLFVGVRGGIGNVLVYLAGDDIEVSRTAAAKVPETAQIKVETGRFSPRVVPVWIDKQRLVFENEDPVHINLKAAPPRNSAMNRVIRPRENFEYSLRRSEAFPFRIGCNFHSWMRAWVLPLTHPYAAVTDDDGTFRIERLPPGEYEFRVWHERAGYLPTDKWPRGRFQVTVEPGENHLGTIKVAPDVFEKNSD